MSFLSLGSDLLGNVFNRNSAKRKNKWSRENMQFASDLKRKDATWMRDELYGGKLTPWEMSGQSGYSASGPQGAAPGADTAPSQGLSQLAETARAEGLQEDQIKAQIKVEEMRGLSSIASTNAGDPIASDQAMARYLKAIGGGAIMAPNEDTLAQRDMRVKEIAVQLDEVRTAIASGEFHQKIHGAPSTDNYVGAIGRVLFGPNDWNAFVKGGGITNEANVAVSKMFDELASKAFAVGKKAGIASDNTADFLRKSLDMLPRDEVQQMRNNFRALLDDLRMTHEGHDSHGLLKGASQ